MRKPFARLGAALLAIVLAAGPAAAQSLFLDETGRSAAADLTAPPPFTLRQRSALLNLGVAAGLGGGRAAADATVTLELGLFPGVTVTATPENRGTAANGATVWTGAVTGDKYGHAVLVINGADVTGSVFANNQVFEIRPLGQGRHRIREVDQAAFPDEHNDFREDPAAAPPLPLPKATPAQKATSGFGRAVTDLPQASSRVTLLALFTPEAKAASYNIIDEIGLAVAVTNQAYARSGMAVQLDLVGIRQFNGVTDNGDLETMLDTITGNATIEGWRDTVQADLVTLLSEVSESYCGLAWLSPGASSAYSSVVRSCAIDNLSFPHELGHNLGARHDRFVDPSSSTTAYNFGYVDRTARVRTVMAYNNDCSNAGFNCTRVGYFSSPNLTLNGRPLGTSGTGITTDNARAIAERAPVAATFRSGTPPTLVIPQSGMWWNTAQSGRGYAIEYYPTTGNLYFGGFLYGADGSAAWYVTACALSGATCTGQLDAYAGGSTLTASSGTGLSKTGSIGQIALAFADSKNGAITWPGGQFTLSRFPIEGTDGSLTPDLSGAVQNGWYYAASELGSGWFFEIQSASPRNRLFALAYMYNAAGQPTWYLASGAMTTSTLFEGRLTEFAGGAPITSPATPPTSNLDRGAVSVQFSSNRTARVTLPTRGITLTRFGL